MKTPTKGWGGFSEGRLAWIEVDAGWGGYATGDFVMVPAIFGSRKTARAKFEDVRRVEISEVKKP